MKARMIGLALAFALACAAQPAAAAEVTGRAMVWERGFDVMYWDSVNGVRTIDRGLEPAISSDGRFVAYIGRGEAQCNPVEVYDVRARTNVSLPGVNVGECSDDPALSGDGRFLVYQSVGGPGDPIDVYLYDVVNQTPIDLPAPVRSASSEESPTLSDDGTRLAFVSGRNGPAFDDVFLADITNPAAPTLIPLPNLNSGEAEREAYMSGDGGSIAFVTGPDFGRSTHIYDRASASIIAAPALTQGRDIFDPALNRSGSLLAVARQTVDLGDTAINIFERANGALSEPSALGSTLSDENPGIADPVALVDDTAPGIKLKCKSKKVNRIACKVTVDEPAKVKLRAKAGPAKAKASKRFQTAGTRKVKLSFKRDAEGKAKVKAKAVDTAGLRGSAATKVKLKSQS